MRTRRLSMLIAAAVAAAHPALGGSPGAPQTWGTANTTWVTVPEWQFSPSSTASGYADFGSPARRYALTPYSAFLASPPLPSGAWIQSLFFDYCNSQPSGGSSILLMLYDLAEDNSNPTLLTQLTGAAGLGCTSAVADLSGLHYTVDNVQHRLLLEAVFGPNGDNSTSFSGAILGYRLQVSPAVTPPLFADVPVTDPGFPYIQALVGAGVTAGCGNGNFCPDAVVTRRQMAVFLSKALGLWWP